MNKGFWTVCAQWKPDIPNLSATALGSGERLVSSIFLVPAFLQASAFSMHMLLIKHTCKKDKGQHSVHMISYHISYIFTIHKCKVWICSTQKYFIWSQFMKPGRFFNIEIREKYVCTVWSVSCSAAKKSLPSLPSTWEMISNMCYLLLLPGFQTVTLTL